MQKVILSANMTVWKVGLFFLFLPHFPTLGEDTVSEDIGEHQLERLVKMLTFKECEDLLFALSHPEEDIFKHTDRLSSENNQLDLQLRTKRDVSSATDGENLCQTALTDWLLKYGEKTYYDRLLRALQHIGRTDIAIEVGKNINQDKTLSLKRYVEDYHKYVNSLNSQSGNANTKKHLHERQRLKKLKLRDLTWRDLDLTVEQALVPLYKKGPLVVILPVWCGILCGFGGSLLAFVLLLLIISIRTKVR